MTEIAAAIFSLRKRHNLTQEALARFLGVSFVSINRWERGASIPSVKQTHNILDLAGNDEAMAKLLSQSESENGVFASRGVRSRAVPLGPLFNHLAAPLMTEPKEPLLDRLRCRGDGLTFCDSLDDILAAHQEAAQLSEKPPRGGLSAGKNTYTYDAHTYHTKVPPQGIAELLQHYLPNGGLVLDMFGGSGMTGVAARAVGVDCVLNELSPAACFIARQFVTSCDAHEVVATVKRVLDELIDLRKKLYSTTCRECGALTEAIYFVWSYRVECPHCHEVNVLWEHCRKYGARVRDHKILKEFPCPSCGELLHKSQLKRHTPEPVLVGYKCCGSRQQEVTHPLDQQDLARILAFEYDPPLAHDWVPQVHLPDGVNLSQPRRHGLDSVAKFYTPRNLAAMSQLWRTIHRIENAEVAAMLAFAFTGLYQRVTRMSEFRFWGGSGNTPRFNVPFIYNESNVFLSFERKVRTIVDHLTTTAQHFRGRVGIVNGSATSMPWLPDASVDLVFTDPPFGANINYSEMNIIWEAWLGRFTDPTDEAIINKVQRKSVNDYRGLMQASFCEASRVLRPDGRMVVVFMNSSSEVWSALQGAIRESGFAVEQVDIFDKQHGTFKHHVSENTAGCDLVLHCIKQGRLLHRAMFPEWATTEHVESSVKAFLVEVPVERYTRVFLHVNRKDETDERLLYSEWLSQRLSAGGDSIDFPVFRTIIAQCLASKKRSNETAD